MSIRYERRRVRVAYQWFKNGYLLRCHDCTPEEKRLEMDFVTPTYAHEKCERCGRVVGEVTVETWATVEIEHVACKIF